MEEAEYEEEHTSGGASDTCDDWSFPHRHGFCRAKEPLVFSRVCTLANRIDRMVPSLPPFGHQYV